MALGAEYDPDKVQDAIDERRAFSLGNMNDLLVTVTTPATADEEFKVTHGLVAQPVRWLVAWRDKAGVVYAGDRATDRTYAYLKCSAASMKMKIIFFSK